MYTRRLLNSQRITGTFRAGMCVPAQIFIYTAQIFLYTQVQAPRTRVCSRLRPAEAYNDSQEGVRPSDSTYTHLSIYISVYSCIYRYLFHLALRACCLQGSELAPRTSPLQWCFHRCLGLSLMVLRRHSPQSPAMGHQPSLGLCGALTHQLGNLGIRHPPLSVLPMQPGASRALLQGDAVNITHGSAQLLMPQQ